MLTVCHCGREEERGQDKLVHDWNLWRDVAVAAGAIVALDTPSKDMTPSAGSAFRYHTYNAAAALLLALFPMKFQYQNCPC